MVGMDGTEFLNVGLPRHGRSAYASRTNDLAGEWIPARAVMRKNAELTLVYDRALAAYSQAGAKTCDVALQAKRSRQ